MSPYSSASTVDLLQTLAERPLLNPWTRPGSIRNRTTVPIDLPKGIADSELLRRVRWAPSPADDIHPDYGQDGGASLMSLLADAVREGTVPVDWEWAANKTILGIGDSLMRNNVMFFADHVSQGKVAPRAIRRRSASQLTFIARSSSESCCRCKAVTGRPGSSAKGWASSTCPSSASRSPSGSTRAWLVPADPDQAWRATEP